MRQPGGVAFLLVVLLAACAGAPAAPLASSIAELRRTYPANRYVVGMGEGASMELARRRAAAEIAGQLRGRLHAAGWVEAESGITGERRIERERVGESIRVETRLTRMEWIEVVSARARGDRVEVLAVLDRRVAAERLRAEIEARAEAIEGEVRRAAHAEGLLARARALAALEDERRDLLDALGTWSSLSRRPAFRPEGLRALQGAREALHDRMERVEWEICLEGETEAASLAVLAGHLAQRGLQARPCGAPASGGERWRLLGDLAAAVQRHEQPGGYPYFCATQLSYRVEGEAERLEAGGSARGLRSGAVAAEEACARSLEGLAADFLERIGWGPLSADAGVDVPFAGPP